MTNRKDQKIVDFLIDKWKKDMIREKEEWDKDPGWPAKLVRTEFELNGTTYTIRPQELGLKDDCWDQGFMESFQAKMRADLEQYGATEIYNFGFLD